MSRTALPFRFLFAVGAALCALAFFTRRAHAGNDEGILAGGHAALTAGAITATVGDGTASWYNPAGLARVEKQTLDINASVYGVGVLKAKPFVRLDDGVSQDATATNWQLIPSALSYARKVKPRMVAAFSIVIPKTTDYDLRTSAVEGGGARWTLGIDTLRNEYDYILSFAWRLSANWRLGFSVHGIYTSTEQKVQASRGQPDMDGTPFATYSQHSKLGDYGLRLGFGMQWSVTPRFDLGFSVQSYTLTGYRDTVDTTFRSQLKSDGDSDFDSSEKNKLDPVWELSTPLSARLGGAYRFGRAQIMLDGSIYTPLNSPERQLERKLMGNARAACMVDLSETLAFGIGLFTDLNGLRAAAPNYVGVAGGVRLAQHYTIAQGGRALEFATTLAGRYAYGWGKATGLRFYGGDESRIEIIEVPLQAHELAFNLGGGVSF